MRAFFFVVTLCLSIGCKPPAEANGPATTPGGATAGDGKADVPVCPVSFEPKTDKKAKTDCSGKVGVTVISQSGEAAAMCVNEGGSIYECIAPQSFAEICKPNGVEFITRDKIKCYMPQTTATSALPPTTMSMPPPAPTKEQLCQSARITNCDGDRACHDSCNNHGCDEGCSGMANWSKANGCWHGNAKC